MTKIGEGERIIKLMLFVRAHGPVTFAEIRRGLAFEYGDEAGSEASTRRRFERDKRTLQEHGIFFSIDDRQRYTLDGDRSFAVPLDLSTSQVSLLRLLCAALLEDPSYPLSDELRMVLIKLGGELEIPDMLPRANSPVRARGRIFDSPVFAKIRTAIASCKRLDFDYTTADGSTRHRVVEPTGCFFLEQACYVVAFDIEAGDTRCFRLDRMGKVHVNAANPNTADFEPRDFDARDHYGLPFQYGDELHRARLLIDDSIEAKAHELALGQGTFEQKGDALVWTVSCRDTRKLARWCIENAPGFEIIEPAEARAAVTRTVNRFLSALEERGAHEG